MSRPKGKTTDGVEILRRRFVDGNAEMEALVRQERKRLETTCAGRGNKQRWRDIVRRTGKCPFCKPHGGENVGRRARDDRGKSHRRIRA